MRQVYFFTQPEPSGGGGAGRRAAAGAGRAQAQAWQAAVPLTTYSSTSCTSTAATATTTGDVYVAGNFSGALNLSGTTLASCRTTDSFVAKWSGAANQFGWAQRLGGRVGYRPGHQRGRERQQRVPDGVRGQHRAAIVGSLPQPVNAATRNTDDAFVAKLTDNGSSGTFA